MSDENFTSEVILSNSTNSESVEYSSEKQLYMLFVHIIFIFTLPAIITNVGNFYVLIQKELRYNPTFLLMLFLCVCDVLTVATSTFGHFQVVLNYWLPKRCFNFGSYLYILIDRISSCILAGSSSLIPWIIITMSFYRAASLSFLINPLFDQITRPFNVIIFIIVVGMLEFFRTTYLIIFEAYIGEMEDNHNCYSVDNMNFTHSDQYTLYIDEKTFIFKLITRAALFVSVLQILCFIVSTVWLIVVVVKANSNKMKLSNTADRNNENTTRLILIMNVFFFMEQIIEFIFLCLVEVSNYGLEVSDYWYALIPLKYVLTFLQSTFQCFICYALSTQYRETAKKCWKIDKRDNIIKVKSLQTSVG